MIFVRFFYTIINNTYKIVRNSVDHISIVESPPQIWEITLKVDARIFAFEVQEIVFLVGGDWHHPLRDIRRVGGIVTDRAQSRWTYGHLEPDLPPGEALVYGVHIQNCAK